MLRTSFLLILLTLSSCGFHSGYGGLLATYKTISVPFVEGDRDGCLTAALVKELSRSGQLRYSSCGGELSLLVTLTCLDDDHIGWRYDYDGSKGITDSLIPTESRMKGVCQVSVQDCRSGTIILGPIEMSGWVDFDHDYYSSRDGVNTFSLGQLSDIDDARDSVLTPLYRELAHKIVVYLNAAW